MLVALARLIRTLHEAPDGPAGIVRGWLSPRRSQPYARRPTKPLWKPTQCSPARVTMCDWSSRRLVTWLARGKAGSAP